jgi:hypothetical protein
MVNAKLKYVALLPSLLLAVGCGTGANVADGGSDFAVGPQVTHIGPAAVTCCMVGAGSTFVMYLANPKPGGVSATGVSLPATGELHLSNPYAVDFVLGQNVPAFGYAFSPDGRYALYVARNTKTNRYQLQAATIEAPQLRQPNVTTLIADGLQEQSFASQFQFSPTGRYLIYQPLPRGILTIPDLAVLDLATFQTVYDLKQGAGYNNFVTPDDTLVFLESTNSTVPGVPSVQGLYLVSLAAGAAGVKPALVDTHVSQFTTTADGARLVYLKQSGELIMFGLTNNDLLTIGTNVVNFSIGASRRGPVVFTDGSGGLHLVPLVGPATITTVADTIDTQSNVFFSPDQQHMYYYKNFQPQDNLGDLYHVLLPPEGNGTPNEIATRASTNDLHFVGGKLIYAANVDGSGATGDFTVAELDGSNGHVIAVGAPLGQLATAFPQPVGPPPTGPIMYGPTDMAPLVTPPVFATLLAAQPAFSFAPIDGTQSIVGGLGLARSDVLGGGAERLVASNVKVFSFSDDGYVLVYADGVKFETKAFNFVGTLRLAQTIVDTQPVVPKLDGVSEIGPVVQRGLFVTAPAANPPGTYYVHY